MDGFPADAPRVRSRNGSCQYATFVLTISTPVIHLLHSGRFKLLGRSSQRIMAAACATMLLIATGYVAAQEQPAKLTRGQLVSDAKVFFGDLEATHPDPYTNLGGKVAFKKKAEQLIRDLPADGLRSPEFTDRLSAFLAPLKDGHTRMRGARERWQDPAPKLAVQFQIASDGLLISSFDLPELNGTRGYKLLAVNSHSVSGLMSRMAAEVATENDYGTYVGLTIALRSSKLLKNLLPDLDGAEGVTYQLQAPDGSAITRKLSWDGEHPAEPEKWAVKPERHSPFEHSDEDFYYRFLPSGESAYLRIANMMPREGYEIIQKYHVGNLKEFLDQYYSSRKKQQPSDPEEAMRGIPSLFEIATNLLHEMKKKNTANLIIDFRGNGGGSTPTIAPFFYEMYGDAYFGRHSEAEFLQVKSPLYLAKYNTSVEQEKEKDPNFELGEYEFTGNEAGTPQEKRNKKLSEWKEKGMSFVPALEALDGKPLYTPKKVIVLCDAGTFSAAFQATFILHEMGAKLVGVPPAQSPNAFMEATEFVLPASGIKGYISNGMQLYVPNDPRVNTLHPDFETTFATFIKYQADEDTPVRFALDLLAAAQM
jgi:hypothetical protein